MKHLITAATILIAGLAHSALANDTVTYEVTDQSYDDVMFGLENAIWISVWSFQNTIMWVICWNGPRPIWARPRQYMPTQMFSDFVQRPYRVLQC